MANAAQSARVLEPFLEADFSAEDHVADLIGTHKQFPTLRNEVADARRIGIQRLQSLVHSNHRTFLQSSRAMAGVLRDLSTLKSGVTSIKQAVASMCAVSFAHQHAAVAGADDAGADTAASSVAARDALGAALAGVDSTGPTALSARLCASCTIPAMAIVGTSRSSGAGSRGASSSSKGVSSLAKPPSTTSQQQQQQQQQQSAGYWRGVSDAVDIALAARRYDEAVDRVIAAASMAAGDGTVEPSVMLLENRVVRAIDAELRALPQTAFELHRPLLVCLLDLGRVADGSEAFLRSQTAWLEEVQRDVAADSGDDWSACTNATDATVAVVAHALDAHQELFRGAELSKLTLWAQEQMRRVATRVLLPTIRSAFTIAAGAGTVGAPTNSSGGNSGLLGTASVGPPSKLGMSCLPLFDAMALAAECAGKAGSLAASGGGALGTAVADALVPGLIELVEAHVAAAEHEATLDGGECAAATVYKLVTTVGRYAGFRKDSVEGEDSLFASDRHAAKLWADLLRCAPAKLHGRQFIGGVGRYLDDVMPKVFTGAAATAAASPPGPTTSDSATARSSRFQSSSSTGGAATGASATGSRAAAPATQPSRPLASASSTMPHSARQQRAIIAALWLGEGTLRLLTRAVELLPPAAVDLNAAIGTKCDPEAAAAAQAVRSSPLLVDVLDAATQQLARAHLFDLRRARDDVYAKHTAGLLEKITSAAASTTPPGSPGVTAADLGLESAEDADFLPAAFIPPTDARIAGSVVAAVAGISFLAWAHPHHFAGARSHHTASLATKAIAFGRSKLLRPLIAAPSPLSIVTGSGVEMERFDGDSADVAFRLERLALTAYNSANATPDAAAIGSGSGAGAPALAKSKHGGRLFGFYFEDVESNTARDVSGLLPFALLLLLKVRQLAFAHVSVFAGTATAACVGRECVVALTDELLCSADFWGTHLPALQQGSPTQQSTAREQIAMFLGCWLHGSEPLLRCPVLQDSAAGLDGGASVQVTLQDKCRTFLETEIQCRSLSLDSALRNAATALASQAFELHEDPEPTTAVGSKQPAASSAASPWSNERSVSLTTLRDSIHGCLGDLAADAVL